MTHEQLMMMCDVIRAIMKIRGEVNGNEGMLRRGWEERDGKCVIRLMGNDRERT